MTFEIKDYFETPVILEPRVELYTVYDFTGLYKESGFCSYPLWTFDETVLKETGGEKYERYARAYDEYMESSFIGMMGAEDETGEEICTGMMM